MDIVGRGSSKPVPISGTQHHSIGGELAPIELMTAGERWREEQAVVCWGTQEEEDFFYF